MCETSSSSSETAILYVYPRRHAHQEHHAAMIGAKGLVAAADAYEVTGAGPARPSNALPRTRPTPRRRRADPVPRDGLRANGVQNSRQITATRHTSGGSGAVRSRRPAARSATGRVVALTFDVCTES